MTIIIVEDNPYTAQDLKSELEYALSGRNDVDYEEAANFSQATKCIENYENNSECVLILDLNMPWGGLLPDEINESKGGLLAGWVWLKNRVLNKPEYDKLNVVVFSAFTSILLQEPSFLSHPRHKKIRLISKDEDRCDNLVDAILEIYKSLTGR